MRRFCLLLGALTLLLGLVSAGPTSASAESTLLKVAKGKIKRAQIATPAGTRVLPGISSGTLSAVLAQKDPEVDLDENDVRADNTADPGGERAGTTVNTVGCGNRGEGANSRVNQDCTFRRQAEELIKVNPANPRNLVAGQNDSRVGFNKCGFDYSFDGGNTWGDGIPPFYQRINNPAGAGIHTVAGGPGTGHSYDAGSDPALAVDSQGRAFFSCVVFDVNSDAGAILVTASVPGAGGSFYSNVPAAGTAFVAAEDNSPLVAHDKEFIAADSFTGSPNRDNVYVTWTVFRFGASCGAPPNGQLQYCSSPIFGSMSTDHAVTWSAPEEISGTSPVCFLGNNFDATRPADACDFDQGSDPVVLPDGGLAVAFNNGNTAPGNPNGQQLAITCHPSGSSVAGTAHLNCGSAVKVGDDVTAGAPACDFGRGPEECVPGSFIRTNDFPRLAVNRANGHLYAAWQDFRAGELDIHLAGSTDGGRTWTGAASSVNPDRGRDHYMPAIDVEARAGDRVGVSYYRTTQVPNEGSGGVFAPPQPGVQAEPSDYALAGGRTLGTPFADLQVSPTFPPPAGNQAGFNGDYSGLVLVGDDAHPIWSDTRNVAPAGQVATTPAPDEDIFSDRVSLPDRR